LPVRGSVHPSRFRCVPVSRRGPHPQVNGEAWRFDRPEQFALLQPTIGARTAMAENGGGLASPQRWRQTSTMAIHGGVLTSRTAPNAAFGSDRRISVELRGSPGFSVQMRQNDPARTCRWDASSRGERSDRPASESSTGFARRNPEDHEDPQEDVDTSEDATAQAAAGISRVVAPRYCRCLVRPSEPA
jgi:hypothetical protein